MEDDPFLPALPPFLASSGGDGPPDPFRPPFRCDDPFRLRACLSSWFASPSLSLNAARVMRALRRPHVCSGRASRPRWKPERRRKPSARTHEVSGIAPRRRRARAGCAAQSRPSPNPAPSSSSCFPSPPITSAETIVRLPRRREVSARDPQRSSLYRPRWRLLRLGLGGWKGSCAVRWDSHQTVVLESGCVSASQPDINRPVANFFPFLPKGRRGPVWLFTQSYRGMQPGPASSIERRIAVVSECKNTDRNVQPRARRVAGSSAPGVEVRIRPPLPMPSLTILRQSDALLFCRDNPVLTPSSMRSRAGPPRASAPPPPSRAALSSSG